MMQALLCCSPVTKARPGNVLCCCQALDPDMLLSCCQVKVSCGSANDRVFCFGCRARDQGNKPFLLPSSMLLSCCKALCPGVLLSCCQAKDRICCFVFAKLETWICCPVVAKLKTGYVPLLLLSFRVRLCFSLVAKL